MKCYECESTQTTMHKHFVIPKSLGGKKHVNLCTNCYSKLLPIRGAIIKAALQVKKIKGEKIGRPSKISDEDKAVIIEAVESGLSIRKTASKFNISKGSVQLILNKHREGDLFYQQIRQLKNVTNLIRKEVNNNE